MNITVASFYTPNDGYPEQAAQLRAECGGLGVPYHIEEREDRGGWLANCRHKPPFLIDAMEAVRGPLLWLDADTSLVAVPTGFRPDMDFMGRAKPAGDDRKWHVDAMYFGATPGAMDLLRRWTDRLADHSDEHAFHCLWEAGEWDGAWAPLPADYSRDGAIVRFRRARHERKRADMAALKRRR